MELSLTSVRNTDPISYSCKNTVLVLTTGTSTYKNLSKTEICSNFQPFLATTQTPFDHSRRSPFVRLRGCGVGRWLPTVLPFLPIRTLKRPVSRSPVSEGRVWTSSRRDDKRGDPVVLHDHGRGPSKPPCRARGPTGPWRVCSGAVVAAGISEGTPFHSRDP